MGRERSNLTAPLGILHYVRRRKTEKLRLFIRIKCTDLRQGCNKQFSVYFIQ